MMNRKRKGTNAERELVHRFWRVAGWGAIRTAGSGSIRYPSPDVLASNGVVRLAIEVKSCEGDAQYISREQIEGLRAFSRRFDAETYIAVRFSGGDWWFLQLHELKEADKSVVVVRTLAETIGRNFARLVTEQNKTKTL